METVEIVIRIPKKNLDEIKAIWNSLFGSTMLDETDIAILSGTILPQGHGRLIDADELLSKERPNGISDDVWEESHIYKMLTNALTVIKADKEECK